MMRLLFIAAIFFGPNISSGSETLLRCLSVDIPASAEVSIQADTREMKLNIFAIMQTPDEFKYQPQYSNFRANILGVVDGLLTAQTPMDTTGTQHTFMFNADTMKITQIRNELKVVASLGEAYAAKDVIVETNRALWACAVR